MKKKANKKKPPNPKGSGGGRVHGWIPIAQLVIQFVNVVLRIIEFIMKLW